MRTPGCTRAVRASGSIARMRLNLASDSSTPSRERQRAARQARARAARDDRNAQRVASREDPLHLLFGLRQRDDHRQLPVRRQAVAFVRLQVFARIEQRARRQERAQRLDDFTLARKVHRRC